MKLIYPAIFHQEDGAYWVEFPDLDGCFSDGNTLEDALSNAKKALSLYCSVMAEDKKTLCPATDVRDIPAPDDGFISLVEGQLTYKDRAVKKTLTIPSWLNDLAVQNNIGFSETLQDALMAKLGLRP